jgi:hypothetical protein
MMGWMAETHGGNSDGRRLKVWDGSEHLAAATSSTGSKASRGSERMGTTGSFDLAVGHETLDRQSKV